MPSAGSNSRPPSARRSSGSPRGTAPSRGFVSIYLPERFIHSLYVHPARHRQGIGQALLDLALRRCGGRAELKCQEGNRGACAFYTRLGWRPVDWGWSTAGPWIRFR